MSILDNETKIKKLDRSNILKVLADFPAVAVSTWQDASKVQLPAEYKQVKNIVIAGMGGSLLGAHIIRFLFWEKIKLPLELINVYELPAYVGPDTLFLAVSHSGNTEETVQNLAVAKRKGAKVLVVAKGGKLGRLVTEGKTPGYLIKENSSTPIPPRMALGYLFIAQLALLKNAGILKVTDAEIKQAVSFIARLGRQYLASVPRGKNAAKQLAEKLYGKSPCLVAADFLSGNAHVFSNQLNENSKTFANYFLLPELDHHLLEGLGFPKKMRKFLRFLFIQSSLYQPRNQRRMEITQEVVESNSVDFITHNLTGKTKLAQSLELLIFGGYVSFYLAMLNDVNPAPNPWVDYFKDKLK